MASHFFPFNPRPTRLALFAGACLLVPLTAWAIAGVRSGQGALAAVRAGVSAVLLALFLLTWHRLRPRPGWGVTLDEGGLTVARPFSGRPLRVPWLQVGTVRRTGRKEDAVGIFLRDQRPVLVARHLFPDRPSFEALVRALEERVPTPPYDA